MFELIKILFAVISGLLVYKSINTNCNKYLAFAVSAIWLRFVLSAFHEITYDPLIAGLSINALGSISIAGLGLFLLPGKVFLLKKLVPFYLLFAVIALSGIGNFAPIDTVNVLVKWAYFLVIACALFLSIRAQGMNTSLLKLFVPFIMPIGLQVMSVLMGEVKATESDGSASYVGGYNHEAAFSMIVVSFLFIVGLIERGSLRFQTAIFSVGIILLVLVNYRTAMLAALPIISIYFYNSIDRKLKARHKVPVLSITVLVGIVLFVIAGIAMQERFADIATVIYNFDDLIKAPEYYTDEEKRLFSARVYLWSSYLTIFFSSDLATQMIGLGPESWQDLFRYYAHNTYVSYLFEYGYLGLLSFVILIFYVFKLTKSIPSKHYNRTTFFTFLGLLVMCLATMPLWNIEGLIFFALLFGIILGTQHKNQHSQRAL